MSTSSVQMWRDLTLLCLSLGQWRSWSCSRTGHAQFLIFPLSAAEWFPKVWSKAPACNSNSLCLLVLHMHRTCQTAREGGKHAAHETHEACRHSLIPCNFVVLEKKRDYLRSPLRSRIGMVEIKQICSALEISTSLQGPGGASCKSWFLPQLFQGGMDPVLLPQTTFISPFVAQNMPQLWGSTVYLFLLLPCTNNPLPLKSLTVIEIHHSSCWKTKGTQHETTHVSILVLLDTDTKMQLLRAKLLRLHFQIRASQQSSLCMFKAVVATLTCGFDYASGSSGCHLLK